MPTQVPFEVPQWLEGWWSLWVPFTAAIHWPAWAAVFTFIALLNVARLADRARREARLKEAVTLYNVNTILKAYASTIQKVLGRFQEPKYKAVESQRARLVTLRQVLERTGALSTIKNFDPALAPTPEVMRAIASCKVIAVHVDRIMERFIESEVAEFNLALANEQLGNIHIRRKVILTEANRRAFTVLGWIGGRLVALTRFVKSFSSRLRAAFGQRTETREREFAEPDEKT